MPWVGFDHALIPRALAVLLLCASSACLGPTSEPPAGNADNGGATNGGTTGASGDGGATTGDTAGSGNGGAPPAREGGLPTDPGGDGEGDASVPVDGGLPDAGAEAGSLCEPPQPEPTLPPVSVGEQPCSGTTESWPDCIPDRCDAPDFADACRQACEMTCERQRWFCGESRCRAPTDALGRPLLGADGQPLTYCDTERAQQECQAACGDDPSCLRLACERTRKASCESFECADPQPERCAAVTCENTCTSPGGSESLALNGVCDDDSPINGVTGQCGQGSDCADCGARQKCGAQGAGCRDSTQCCGFETGDAVCAYIGPADDPYGRCVPTCSASASCPGDFFCWAGSQPVGVCFPNCVAQYHPKP